MRSHAWRGSTWKFTSELFRRNPLCMRYIRSISSDTGAFEADHVPGSSEDMGNPIMASVSGTFPMALMILSTYVKPFIGKAAYYIWFLAIILHIILIIYFTVKFVLKLQMPKVFASYYIVYVGIAVAAVTAPAYEQLGIGTAAFWFGFVTLIVLLVLVTYRYVKFKEVPDPAKPR